MSKDTSEDASAISHLNLEFDGVHLGSALAGDIQKIIQGIQGTIASINKFYPYLCGLYYTDPQRSVAEQHLFRLQTTLSKQQDALTEALGVACDLGRPVPVSITI